MVSFGQSPSPLKYPRGLWMAPVMLAGPGWWTREIKNMFMLRRWPKCSFQCLRFKCHLRTYFASRQKVIKMLMKSGQEWEKGALQNNNIDRHLGNSVNTSMNFADSYYFIKFYDRLHCEFNKSRSIADHWVDSVLLDHNYKSTWFNYSFIVKSSIYWLVLKLYFV